MRCRCLVLALAACVTFALIPSGPQSAAAPPPDRHPRAHTPAFATGFEQRDGAFVVSAGRLSAAVRAADAALTIGDRESARMLLVGARSGLLAEPMEPLPGVLNYLIGNDPARWRVGVRRYAALHFPTVYPGIDLVYREMPAGVEYDFVVRPGADPQVIRTRFDGVDAVAIDPDGDLVISSARWGAVRHRKPSVWQEIGGRRNHTDAAFVLSRNDVGFSIGPYDASAALTIDPYVMFTTYLGRNITDAPRAVAVDASGNSYIAGTTAGDLPATPDAFQPKSMRAADCFVVKLDPEGKLVYLTYLGGTNSRRAFAQVSVEGATGIAVDAAGQVVIAGSTESTDFPVVNASHKLETPSVETTGFWRS